MRTMHSRNNTLKIPGHWTEAQADAVFEFVNELAAAIFNAYEKDFIESAKQEIMIKETDDNFGLFEEKEDDDDIPC